MGFGFVERGWWLGLRGGFLYELAPAGAAEAAHRCVGLRILAGGLEV